MYRNFKYNKPMRKLNFMTYTTVEFQDILHIIYFYTIFIYTYLL